jgi:hypothetical protein
MKFLDSKGRLFGKLSILDLGAALTMLAIVIGIFVVPGTSGTNSIAQVPTQPIEVDVIVRGLSVKDPATFVKEFSQQEKTNIIIRNQPAGTVDVQKVTPLPRNILVTQPDGTVKYMSDPRPESAYSQDMILTLAGQAQVTETGAVVGGQKVKIGTLLELEGKEYNFNTSVIDIRFLKK